MAVAVAAAIITSSSFLHGDALSSSSSTFYPLSGSGCYIQSPKRFFVFSKRISGLEEAMRIRRERELSKKSTGSMRRLPLRRGKVSPRLPVPDHIQKPPYTSSTLLPEISSEYQIHDAEGLSKMKAACKLAAQVLDYAGTLVRPSVTTNEIDEAVHQMIIEAGAYPSPLGYGRFPKSVCTSVNECMCHGIPDSRKLKDGDIINIDVTVYLNGYHGDTSKTFLCGNVDDGTKKLVKVTEECLQIGISVCKDGAPFRNIGNSISEHAEKFGYGVVDRFVGHGVGTVFHSEPLIYHDQWNFFAKVKNVNSEDFGGCFALFAFLWDFFHSASSGSSNGVNVDTPNLKLTYCPYWIFFRWQTAFTGGIFWQFSMKVFLLISFSGWMTLQGFGRLISPGRKDPLFSSILRLVGWMYGGGTWTRLCCFCCVVSHSCGSSFWLECLTPGSFVEVWCVFQLGFEVAGLTHLLVFACLEFLLVDFVCEMGAMRRFPVCTLLAWWCLCLCADVGVSSEGLASLPRGWT